MFSITAFAFSENSLNDSKNGINENAKVLSALLNVVVTFIVSKTTTLLSSILIYSVGVAITVLPA